MTKGGGADNITKMNLGTFTNKGGLTPHHIRIRFIAFDTDSASILQGKMNDVTYKLQVSHVPHM